MRFEVRVEHVPWKPVTRADLGPAPSVTRVSVGPGNAHVRVAVQASQDRQGHTRPALYEDPIPVDFPDLTAPKKHQVGQDQHGGGTRGKSGMQSPASSWGEELGQAVLDARPLHELLDAVLHGDPQPVEGGPAPQVVVPAVPEAHKRERHRSGEEGPQQAML